MPSLRVQISQPCGESWATMTPTGPGRHCAACQQVVIDFTAFTDGELAAYLGRPSKPPCGRFRASQLNRVLLPAAAPVAGWRRWLRAAVALLGLGSLAIPARAQTRPVRVSQAQAPPQGDRHAVAKLPKPRATHAPLSRTATENVAVQETILSGAPSIDFAPDTVKPRK